MHLLWGLLDVSVAIFIEAVPAVNALAAMAVNVVLFAFVERDGRMLWTMLDSFSKSDTAHKALFNHSTHAVYIVNLAGQVEYVNHIAKASSKQGISIRIQDNFPLSCRTSLDRLLHTVSTGASAAFEVILKPSSLSFEQSVLTDFAVRLEGKPISWKLANCMLLTAKDITNEKAQEILMYSRLKKANDQLNVQIRELARTYREGSTLRRVDLRRQLNARHEFLKLSYLQMSLIGNAEFEQVRFSPFEEALKSLELVTDKAYEKRIEMSLKKNPNIPQVVLGSLNATDFLLHSFAEFCLLEVTPGEQLDFFIEVAVWTSQASSGRHQRLRYRAEFRGNRLSTERLKKIFLQKLTLEETPGIVAMYGTSIVAFKSVLKSLGGYVEEAFVHKGATHNAVVLSYT